MQKDFYFDFFIETSAKTGLNTKELFVQAGKLLYNEYTKFKKKPKKTGEVLKKEEKSSEKKKKCC